MPEDTHGYLDGIGGARLFYRAREVDNARGRLLVLHGLGEHSGRYGAVAAVARAASFDFYALDHRGHGKSRGRRGHVRSFDHLLQDVDRFRRRASQGRGSGPTFVLGHSLGGLIAGRYIQEFSFPGLTGAVLMAPFVQVAMRIPGWKSGLARAANALLPALTLDNGLREEDMFRDQAEQDRYRSDPLVHRRISARLWAEMLRNGEQLTERAAQVRLPVLFQLAGDDRVVNTDASRRVAQRMGVAAQVREYPDAFHDLYRDPLARSALGDVSEWLEARVAEAEATATA
jgi:lysophospholipase